jgi:hypothetical protein
MRPEVRLCQTERQPEVCKVELNGLKQRNDSHRNVLLPHATRACSYSSLQEDQDTYLGFIGKHWPVVYLPPAFSVSHNEPR